MRFTANMCGVRVELDATFKHGRMQRITSPDIPELDLHVENLDGPEIAAQLVSHVGFWAAYRPGTLPPGRKIEYPRDI